MHWRILLSTLIALLFLWPLLRLLRSADPEQEEPARAGVRGLLYRFQPLRERLPPRWLLPTGGPDAAQVRDWVERAAALYAKLLETLPHSGLEASRQQELRQQARQALRNMLELAWSLHRLRSLQALLPAEDISYQEVEDMSATLLHTLHDALQVLQNLPVSLLKLELSGDCRVSDALLADLNESNQRMHDLIQAHALVD